MNIVKTGLKLNCIIFINQFLQRKKMADLETKNIINSLNNLSFNHEDLMSVMLDFSDSYIENHKIRILPYFDNPYFLQQTVLCVREALVLSVNGLILAKEVSYKDILDGCINQEAQDYHLRSMKLNPVLKKEILLFWSSLRKDIFTNIYEKNRKIIEMTKVSSKVIDERYRLFIKRCS